MDKEYLVKGKLTDNADGIVFDHPKSMRRLLRALMGKTLDIKVKVFRKTNSTKQKRWLWGVAYTMIQEWYLDTYGEPITKEKIHLHNMQAIQGFTYYVEEIQGVEVIIADYPSLSEMTTVEFNEMKRKLQIYYDILDLFIPDPQSII